METQRRWARDVVRQRSRRSVRDSAVSRVRAATSAGRYPCFNGVWQAPLVVASRLLIVNRGASPFGAGWWPAGVEQLHPAQDADGSAMLELGDGSALFFQKAAGAFRSPPGERSVLSQAGTGFKRVLDNRRETVWYSAAGLVDSITDNNPLRNRAVYAWSGQLLTSITDPVGKQIVFGYDASARVSQISVPALNPVQLFQSAHGSTQLDLDSIADPDGYRTRFSYATATHRMICQHFARNRPGALHL